MAFLPLLRPLLFLVELGIIRANTNIAFDDAPPSSGKVGEGPHDLVNTTKLLAHIPFNKSDVPDMLIHAIASLEGIGDHNKDVHFEEQLLKCMPEHSLILFVSDFDMALHNVELMMNFKKPMRRGLKLLADTAGEVAEFAQQSCHDKELDSYELKELEDYLGACGSLADVSEGKGKIKYVQTKKANETYLVVTGIGTIDKHLKSLLAAWKERPPSPITVGRALGEFLRLFKKTPGVKEGKDKEIEATNAEKADKAKAAFAAMQAETKTADDTNVKTAEL